MESLTSQILRSDAEAECPQCEYPMWLRMSEIVVGTTVICPCCRTRVRLVNERGSATTVGREIEAELNRMIKGWSA